MDDLRQLREENERLKRENHALRERLATDKTKIKQLIELLGQNSIIPIGRPAEIKVAKSQNPKACDLKQTVKQVDRKDTKDIPLNSILTQM